MRETKRISPMGAGGWPLIHLQDTRDDFSAATRTLHACRSPRMHAVTRVIFPQATRDVCMYTKPSA